MTANRGIPQGLPEEFAPEEKSYSLYEDIEYQEYWDDPGQARQDALEKRLITDLLPETGRRIIDVGCGYGRLAPCYLDRFDVAVLFDGSMSLLRQAHEAVGDRAVIVAGDVMNLPFKAASFDQVLSIRVLQHVRDLDKAVHGLRSLLARDGQLLFSYHNKRNANRVLHYLRSRRIADPFSLDSAEVSPTLISHHPERMGSILSAAGFSAPEYRGAVVLDRLARVTEKLGGKDPAGLKWARFTGEHRLAPWLVGSTRVEGGEVLLEAESLSELFECPSCRGELVAYEKSYRCTACRADYPVRDGIVDFRLQGG